MVETCTDERGRGGGGNIIGGDMTAFDGAGDDFTEADRAFLEWAAHSAEARAHMRQQKLLPEIGRSAIFPLTNGDAYFSRRVDVPSRLTDPYSAKHVN